MSNWIDILVKEPISEEDLSNLEEILVKKYSITKESISEEDLSNLEEILVKKYSITKEDAEDLIDSVMDELDTDSIEAISKR